MAMANYSVAVNPFDEVFIVKRILTHHPQPHTTRPYNGHKHETSIAEAPSAQDIIQRTNIGEDREHVQIMNC